MKALLSFAFGLLFGAGLLLSGMTSPLRVLGFLDIAGHWDPSLAFVMGGAVLAAAPLFARSRRGQPPAVHSPIDRRLIGGSAIFGIGWGIAEPFLDRGSVFVHNRLPSYLGLRTGSNSSAKCASH